MRRDRHTIQGALPIVARAVGRKLDVTVRIGGTNAYTDGKNIQLPALPLDEDGDRLATLAFGYLEHEAAHVRYTDMDNYKPDSPVHQMFTNIFEDVRIEKALGGEYPGFAEDLRGLTEILVEKGEMGGDLDPNLPLAAKVGNHALLKCRHEVLGPDVLEEPAAQAEESFRDAVPADLADAVDAALAQVEDLESTEEAANLARDVVKLIADEQQQQAQQAMPGGVCGAPQPGGDAGEGEAGSGETGDDVDGEQAGGNAGGSQAGDDGEDSQDGGDTGGGQTGDDVDGEQAGGNAGGSQAGDDGEDSQDGGDAGGGQADYAGDNEARKAAAEMAEALQELLDDNGDSAPKTRCQAAADALKQEASDANQAAGGYGGGGGAGVGEASEPLQVTTSGAAEIASVSAATVALRTRLRGLLAAERLAKRTVARRGKRLSRGRLVKALQGNPNIFVNKTRGVAVNTAVQILLDRSGSMHGEIALARESALACALGLSEIQGVSVAAATFPGDGAVREVTPLTAFGEPVRRTAGRYAAVNATGGTPMLEALLWGVDQLLVQPEPRLMCLVVTDGEPYDRVNTEAVIQRCWAGGIEVMGIGMGRSAHYVESLFPVSAHIEQVEDLAGAMFTMLREALAGRPAA